MDPSKASLVNNMTGYPPGIYTLAEPERLAIRRWNLSNDWYNSYMTNDTLYCIPERKTNGWQCVNPRRDYQNDVRLPMTPTNVVEIRVAYTNFTQGIAKICALPEYFPGDVRNEFKGDVLYVKMIPAGTNLQFVAYRQWDVGFGDYGRTNIAPPVLSAYVGGQSVSLQIGATNLSIYYGSSVVTNVAHGLTNALEVYANGVYPHYEFLNSSNTTTATVQMKMLRCGSLGAFTPP